jgi:hypothetical protein
VNKTDMVFGDEEIDDGDNQVDMHLIPEAD